MPGKKILIVGNGAISGQYGKRIDSDEFHKVIRLNRFEALMHMDKVGTRMDILATRANTLTENLRGAPLIWLLGGISSKRFWDREEGRERNAAWAVKFRKLYLDPGGVLLNVPRKFWQDSCKDYNRRQTDLWRRYPKHPKTGRPFQGPTTGILAIVAAWAEWEDAEVHLLGFDGCKTGHYYEPDHKHNTVAHDLNMDRTFLMEWTIAGKIVMLEGGVVSP